MQRLVGVVLGGLLLSTGAVAQGFDEVEIETLAVAEGLHMLVGRGGNIAVSTGADGPLLVDDQYALLVPRIEAAVRRLQDAPVAFVLNTHFHGDHVGGNEALGGAGAVIMAHDRVRGRMSTRQVAEALGRDDPAYPADALPVVTFAESLSLHWNGLRIEVVHAPAAHTDGDAVVWFHGADAVHMGDTFFNGTYPFIDIFSGGSIDGMIAVADAVLERAGPETRVIPGHGALASVDDLRAYRAMLGTVRERVEAALAADEDLEAFVGRAPLADLDARWGGGFMKAERLLRLVWADLSRGQAAE